MTGDGFSSDAVNNTHLVINSAPIAVTSGQEYTFTTFAKAGNELNASIRVGEPKLSDGGPDLLDLAPGMRARVARVRHQRAHWLVGNCQRLYQDRSGAHRFDPIR